LYAANAFYLLHNWFHGTNAIGFNIGYALSSTIVDVNLSQIGVKTDAMGCSGMCVGA
jgi:hypothetical protein